MKRLIAMLCIFALVLSVSAAAFADVQRDEDGYAVIGESMMNSELEDGTWVTFFSIFKMVMPSDWVDIDITDRDRENGLYYAARAPQEDATVELLVYTPEEIANFGAEDIFDICEIWKADGYEDAQIMKLNGVYCCFYTNADRDACHVMLMSSDNYMFDLIFGPISNDDYTSIYYNMIYSLQGVS